MQYPFFKKHLSQKNCYLLTQNIASLLKSHIPLLQALFILHSQEKSPLTQKILSHCINIINTGNPLSLALSNFPKSFDPTYINVVKAGELSGKVDIAFDCLANFEEKKLKVLNKITSALTYPIIVLITSLLLCVFLFTFILPKFQTLFQQLPTPIELPFLTNFLFSLTHHPRLLLYWITVPLFIFYLIKKILFKNQRVTLKLHAAFLKLPLIGSTLLNKNLFFFYKTLSTLLASGTPFINAYTLSLATLSNQALIYSLIETRQKIKDGIPFASALHHNPYLPPTTPLLLKIGEETSTLIPTLNHLADTFETNFNQSLTRLTGLLEPALLLLLATIIGSIILSLFLPLTSLLQNFSL